MTQLTPPPPPQVLLHLRFDVDQRGSDLNYALTRSAPNTPDPQPQHGVHACGIYFVPGEQVLLQVTASGDKSGDNAFVSFQILDCAIITRPRASQRGIDVETRFAPPSPFLQAVGACYPLPLDFYATAEQLEPLNRYEVHQTWKRSLDVSPAPGLWELSLVLTVRIMRGPGSIDEVRVFSFDPETEVGSTGMLRQDPATN